MEENIDVKKIFKRMKKIKYGFLINNKYHDPYKNKWKFIPHNSCAIDRKIQCWCVLGLCKFSTVSF